MKNDDLPWDPNPEKKSQQQIPSSVVEWARPWEGLNPFRFPGKRQLIFVVAYTSDIPMIQHSRKAWKKSCLSLPKICYGKINWCLFLLDQWWWGKKQGYFEAYCVDMCGYMTLMNTWGIFNISHKLLMMKSQFHNNHENLRGPPNQCHARPKEIRPYQGIINGMIRDDGGYPPGN